MSGILTKLVRDPQTGAYSEVEGTILDLVNPAVPLATTQGTAARLVIWLLAARLL